MPQQWGNKTKHSHTNSTLLADILKKLRNDLSFKYTCREIKYFDHQDPLMRLKIRKSLYGHITKPPGFCKVSLTLFMLCCIHEGLQMLTFKVN